MTHPSNPDQLMARALGVCWHSPTADRWPCQEPLADWEIELAHKQFRVERQVCGCDQDPIECNHEAALGEVEEKLHRVRLLGMDLDALAEAARYQGRQADDEIEGLTEYGRSLAFSDAAERLRRALGTQS